MFNHILGSSNRLHSQDFLRGFAILIIFFAHFGMWDLEAVGVDLFFVISGNLVSYSLLATLRKSNGSFGYKNIFHQTPF